MHWNNLIGVPSLSYDGHNHDDRYYTESEINSLLSGKADWGHNHDDRYYTKGQSDSRYLQSESDPHGFDSHWFSVSGSTVTLGIQKRNGAQQYASFNVPSSGGGNYLDKTSGVGNTIYSYNVFEYPTVFNATIQTNGGIYMNSQIFSLFSTQTLGATPSISNEVLPINVGGVTKYILLKS